MAAIRKGNPYDWPEWQGIWEISGKMALRRFHHVNGLDAVHIPIENGVGAEE